MIDFDELAADLVDYEGLKLLVYDDATGKAVKPGTVLIGHPTIGIGRCLDTHGITRDEAFYLVRNDIEAVGEQLTKSLPWFAALDPVRQAALADMAFNVGLGGLLSFHDTLSFIAAGHYDSAAEAMLASKWATQVRARAARLAETIRTGKPVPR